jgi:hypothetical protein
MNYSIKIKIGDIFRDMFGGYIKITNFIPRKGEFYYNYCDSQGIVRYPRNDLWMGGIVLMYNYTKV